MDDTRRQQLITAFENFKKAYDELVTVWGYDSDVNDLAANSYYPFEHSLDEINVEGWCYAAIVELKRE